MASPKRPAPYRNYKFQVTFDGKIVAGVNKVSALTRTSEVVSWRDGGDPSSPHKSGQVDFGPITLEQGLTEDVESEQWANKVWDCPNSTRVTTQLRSSR